MKGNICIVSETGWAVSNDATLDYHKERIKTDVGDRIIGYGVFEVTSPFGDFKQDQTVDVAFQAEDGKNVSYRCTVTKKMESGAFIRILDQTNEYKQIVERVLSWQKTMVLQA